VLLAAALGRMMRGWPGDELLELARAGCVVDRDLPEVPVLASVAELLDRRGRYAAEATEPDGVRTPGFQLVAVAAAVARAPSGPLPALDA
jgi:hypothetical protein